MSDRDLHLPEQGEPTAVAVVLHPHPGMGGDRHHPAVVAIAQGLAAHGVAALRLDLRDPDPAPSAERLRAAATDLLADLSLERLLLVGYSWGSIVAALVDHEALRARVLVAPPVSMFVPASGDGTPTLVLVPAHDQFGPPDAVREALGSWPVTTIEVVDGADHFLAGAVQRVADRTVSWLVDGVVT
jgi:alpha/beta superfamily hydrolase